MYRSRRFSSSQTFSQKLILWGLIGLGGLILFGFLASLFVFAWYGRNLPSPGKLSEVTSDSTVFYDRDGKVLYEIYKDKNRVPVASADISKYLKEGTVAIEDKNFYKHNGISQLGIIRAFINTLLGRGVQGGSTITQQLIKNVLLTSERSIGRKVKEAILASEVERKYTKDQILEMYLNEAPYGGTYYGVGAASKGYFDKEPKDLSIIEAAILAGLPQSPTYYSPYIGTKDAWKGRAKNVLRRMREDGYIDKKQELAADSQVDTYHFSAPRVAITAPHYVFYVRNQIEKQYGVAATQQGLKVKTTIDSDLQKKVEQIVKDEIEGLKSAKVGNGAVVVLDSKTSEVLAYVGSYDFNNEEYGKFDVAGSGQRQPGSALKPIIYTLAFEKGYTPATVIMDVKTPFYNGDQMPEYIPVNYDGKFHGPMQLRFALGNSMNIPAVKLLAMVGLRDFLEKGYESGLHSYQPTEDNMKRFGLAVALGGGETNLLDLTSAYTVLASSGIKRDVQLYSEITDYRGKKLYKASKPRERRVFSPETAFLTSHILSDNVARTLEFGPNSYLHVPGKTVAVKTGTTNDKRDNWAVGFTNSITVGVWVGNNDNSPMDPKIASGVTGASSIWYKIMTEALKKYPDGIANKPDNVKALQIDAYLGGLPKDSQQTRSEYFVEGTEPKDVAPFYKKLKISRSTGKLANEVEIRNGNYDEKDYIVFTENDPVSTDGKNRWQDAINDWTKDQTDDKLKPPTEISSNNADDVAVSITSPSDHAQLDSNDVEVKARIGSVAAIRTVKIIINGSEVKIFNEDKKDIDEHIHLDDGVYELKVNAQNDKDKSAESTIRFGVNRPWDSGNPTPSPAPSPTPTH